MDWSNLLLWLLLCLPLVRLLLKRFVYFPRYYELPEDADEQRALKKPEKTVLVTGGNKGIGEALTRMLLKDLILGSRTVQRVVVVARDSEAVKYTLLPGLITQIESATKRLDDYMREFADQFVISLQNGTWDKEGNFASANLVFIKQDLSIYNDLKNLLPLLQRFGVRKLDAVVFNAGTISDIPVKTGSKDIESVAAVNLVSPLLLARLLKPLLSPDCLMVFNCGSTVPYSFSSGGYSPDDPTFQTIALSPKPKDFVVLKQYFNTKALLRLAVTRSELRQHLQKVEQSSEMKVVGWDPGFTRHWLGSSRMVFPWSKPPKPQTNTIAATAEGKETEQKPAKIYTSGPTKGLLLILLELVLIPIRYGLCRDSEEAAARFGEFLLDYLSDSAVRTKVMSGEVVGPWNWKAGGFEKDPEVFGRLGGDDNAVKLVKSLLESDLFTSSN